MNEHQVHGSGCTEAFFRGHVERETRLREGDEVERGSGVKGPKAGRRASMVEVLRRIRLSDRGGDGNGGDGSRPFGVSEEGEGGEDEEGELMFQPERLDALALALKERGHTLPARISSTAAKNPLPAAAAASTTASSPNTVSVDAAVKVSTSGGSKLGGSLPSSSSSSDVRTPSSSNRRGAVAGGGGELPRRGSRRAQRKARPAGFEDDRVQEHEQQQQQQRLVDNGDDEGMLDLLTEEEKGRFFREVASGRLGKLIVPWVPWWTQAAGVQEVAPITAGGRTSHSQPPPVVDPFRHHLHHHQHAVCSSFGAPPSGGPGSSPPTRPATPEQPSSSGSEFPASRSGTAAVATAAGEEEEEAEGSSSPCTRHSFAALLSQAFQAPGFSTINARKPSPTLPALATDLAYAYVLTSRLYNGCWCSDPVGASLALVRASPVLQDGATPATAREALAACVERAVEGERAGFRGYAESLRQVSFFLDGGG